MELLGNGAINSIANNICFLLFYFHAVPEFNVIKHINAISSQNIWPSDMNWVMRYSGLYHIAL